MTNNTIPNVPRELLERASNLAFQTQHYPLHEELRALLSAPSSANHVEDVRAMVAEPVQQVSVPPFAQKVIRKLERFQECTDDGQGADIGRHWFDLLTQLGLLNRVQRSPALWEITQQGEDLLAAAPAAPAADAGLIEALDYQALFDAIAAATSVYANGAINISVQAFRDALAANSAKGVV